jgi:hypothetical protein
MRKAADVRMEKATSEDERLNQLLHDLDQVFHKPVINGACPSNEPESSFLSSFCTPQIAFE